MSDITEINARSRDSMAQLARDVWRYRELLLTFMERDIKVRYKQTVIGVVWVVLQPLVNSLIFVVLFSRVAKMPTPGLPPMIFFMAAFVPWTCFSNSVALAASSLESNANLIGKVYFPRLIVPGAAVLATLVDFVVSWLVFNFVVATWGLFPGQHGASPWTWRLIPFTFVLLALQLAAAFGIGAILSVLNAQYRDIRHALPFMLQTAMWITPVAWPVQLLQEKLGKVSAVVVFLNPMAGVIETYRALLSGAAVPYQLLCVHALVSVALLAIGIVFFSKRMHRIVDLL